jgi:drug/metabolite transporter (DMT)-like permease
MAGLFLGAVSITLRRALARVPDVDAGSAVVAVVAFLLIAAATLVSGVAIDAGELWPFLLSGVFVPGLSQLLVVHAVHAAGASRAGILFGMAPLFSALIAIAVFGEPFRWPLAAGTLLVVTGGILLAWEAERPVDYRAYGAFLAVIVAGAFGVRDNVTRAVSEEVAADPLAQAAALLLGASIVLAANLLIRPSPVPRLRAAVAPFALSGVVIAVGQATLFEALDRARVTVVAPLAGTGVLWTVVFAAIFLGRSELVGRRLVVVALLVVAGGTLVGATR